MVSSCIFEGHVLVTWALLKAESDSWSNCWLLWLSRAALFQMKKMCVLSVSALSDFIIKTTLKYYPISQQKTLALYVPGQEEASLRADPALMYAQSQVP